MIDAEKQTKRGHSHGILPLRTGYQTRRPDPRNAPSPDPGAAACQLVALPLYYVVLIAAALLAVGYFVWNRVTEVQPDYAVAVVSRTDPDIAFLSQLEIQLEALAGDVNGDGKVKVTVKGIWLALDFETQDAALQRLMQSSEDKLNSDFYLCESTLFIVDDPTAMEQRYGCFQTLDGTDPAEGDVLSVADFALPLQDTALANVQSESSTLWYAARRLNEGMDADTAAALNALWEKLV